jgi:hypothetical protein
VIGAEVIADEKSGTAEQELLAAERHAALHEAFAALPPSGQRLIALLLEDPPASYTDISARLGIPVGSIGPTRRRCLDKLRRYPAVAALINTDTSSADEMTAGQPRGGALGQRRLVLKCISVRESAVADYVLRASGHALLFRAQVGLASAK